MDFEFIRMRDADASNAESIVLLAEELKRILQGRPLSEEDKQHYASCLGSGSVCRKKDGVIIKENGPVYVLVNRIEFEGCIVLMKEYLDRINSK